MKNWNWKKIGRVYKDYLKPLNVSFAPYHYGLSCYIIIKCYCKDKDLFLKVLPLQQWADVKSF